MNYENFFYVPDEASANALAADLQQRGHLIDRVGPTDWIVVSVMRLSFDFDFDDDPRDELQALAERHGGRYDGGGTYVGPISHLLPEDPHPESAP